MIKRFEGYRETAYKCQAGVLTCGYGHTQGVGRHTVCTEDIATQWLKEDLASAEAMVGRELPDLPQERFDALVSFVFNLGGGAFKNSTLLKMIRKEPDDVKIRAEFLKWKNVRIDGVLTPSEGLLNRRTAEAELYFKGNYKI